MNIAVDVMGGDHGPEVLIPGAIAGARRANVGVLLVGKREAIEPILAKTETQGVEVNVVHASEEIGMDDSPALAVRRKRDASMSVAITEMRAGRAVGMVSAGNSGAVMASALMHLGRIPGIDRPALASEIPTLSGSCFLLDLGAVVDPRPMNLVQFAVMARVYAELVSGRRNPTVGLLSNGEEPSKGNALVLEVHGLLASHPGVNFIGNVEGRELLEGRADIVVTDGFTGNVALKTMEGTASVLSAVIRREITRGLHRKLAAAVLRPAFRAVGKQLDYQRFGGAPLLGVNGVTIVAHGRSSVDAISSAVTVAARTAELDVVGSIARAIALENSEARAV